MKPAIDLAGQKFGAWTVLERAAPIASCTSARWCVRCQCGNESTANSADLRKGRTRSCSSCANRMRSRRDEATRPGPSHGGGA